MKLWEEKLDELKKNDQKQRSRTRAKKTHASERESAEFQADFTSFSTLDRGKRNPNKKSHLLGADLPRVQATEPLISWEKNQQTHWLLHRSSEQIGNDGRIGEEAKETSALIRADSGNKNPSKSS